MYRVSKVLNNNGVIAINMEENIEYVLLGKGIGFGKKISERFEAPDGCARYSLREDTERGSAKELAKSIAPEYLEIANAILVEARKKIRTYRQKNPCSRWQTIIFFCGRSDQTWRADQQSIDRRYPSAVWQRISGCLQVKRDSQGTAFCGD